MTGLTGEYRGIVDRIVDGETAVVLIEDDLRTEVTRPIDDLPANTTEGAVLDLVLEDGEVTESHVRDEETRRRQEALEDRLDDLSRRLSEK
jgi:hypothetical protein